MGQREPEGYLEYNLFKKSDSIRLKQMSSVDYEHELDKAPLGQLTFHSMIQKHSTKYLKNTN